MSKIAILGAGIGGMTAAYELLKAGHQVTVFEKNETVGGMAGGFRQENWQWSVEYFYHHWFQSDHAILSLINKLGWKDRVRFFHPKTVVYHKEKFYPLDSPLAALLFPGFALVDKVRFGLVTLYLRYFSDWKSLEKYTAHEWMKRYYGVRLYETFFEPLLIGKFNHYYQKVTMAWFWARFKARTSALGTFDGGFQSFLDKFRFELEKMNVDLRFNISITNIQSQNNKLVLHTKEKKSLFDKVLVTTSPKVLANLAPGLPEFYSRQLSQLESIGAVGLILVLRYQLSKEGYYWFNLPKEAGFPFLALVEHTNFVNPKYFGNQHIIYCGDYLPPDHEYFRLTKEQLLEKFTPSLKRININFKPEWIKQSFVFRLSYAQPVPLINHSKNIPEIQTPIKNLYFASMSQVYPWDRGTNYAVALSQKAVKIMLE